MKGINRISSEHGGLRLVGEVGEAAVASGPKDSGRGGSGRRRVQAEVEDRKQADGVDARSTTEMRRVEPSATSGSWGPTTTPESTFGGFEGSPPPEPADLEGGSIGDPCRVIPKPAAPAGGGAARGLVPAGPEIPRRIEYDYRDTDGTLLYQVVRGLPKRFFQRRPDPSEPGKWINDLEGVEPTLYRLPELAAAHPSRRVYLVEGEKDADRLTGLGLVATTNPAGAGKWLDRYAGSLRGRRVVVLPDNDEVGRRHALEVGASLAGVAESVKILELPGLSLKDDVSDWLDGGGTVEELERLADAAAPYVAPRAPGRATRAEAAAGGPGFVELAAELGLRVVAGRPNAKGWRRCRAVGREDANPSAAIRERDGRYRDFGKGETLAFAALAMRLRPATFPDERAVATFLRDRCVQALVDRRPFGGFEGGLPAPLPLNAELPAVPALPPEFLPHSLRDWLVDAAERMSCQLDYLAVGAVVALAAVVGRRATIRPKRQDPWTVVPNLWGAVVGPPGRLKSAALAEATRHLRALAEEARTRHEAALREHRVRMAVEAARADAAKMRLKKAAASDKADRQALEALAEQVAGGGEEAPPLKRYLVNDATVEKLGELLRENPDGLLQYRDELTGWLRSMEKPGREADRAFYLECWNGDGSFAYDRIGRGTVRIEAACLSILGGIQPGPLASCIREAARADDGLIPRLQLMVYPDPSPEWRNVDRPPDADAGRRAGEVFRRLDALDATSLGAERDEGGSPFFRFSGEAQGFFDEWRGNLENGKLRSPGGGPLMESCLAKQRSLMPSLALLFHLADAAAGGAAGPVSLGATKLAAAWCDYLEAHARRVHAVGVEDGLEPARRLADKIRSGGVPSPFTARMVAQNGWSGLDASARVERAAEALESRGWVRAVRTVTGGRPKREYLVNPSALEGPRS